MRTDDGRIIHKCLNGESEAFGFLVDKYKESVYAFAYSKLRNFHDAEDVTQEVFIKAYRKLRTLRRWDSFHAWLYCITSNHCKTWIRARSRRPDCDFMEDKDPKILEIASIDSYRESLERESLHESLQEALNSLPKAYCRVLTLYYLGGMSNREIARFLGTSPAAVKQCLCRARAQLKGEILAMMSATYEKQRLPTGFTFRIVEAVKRIKIHPTPRTTSLPWGLSLAAGVIIAVLNLSPYLNLLNPAAALRDSTLPGQAKVLKTGEIPVDILNISHVPIISSMQADGDSGKPEVPDPQNALLLAPQVQGGTWMSMADMPTARAYMAASVVDGKIYVIGGRAGADAQAVIAGEVAVPNLPTTAEYDPVTDTWTKKADMPTARRGVSTCVLDGKIYAIGGWERTNSISSAVEVYDPGRNTWTKRPGMASGGRGDVGTAVVDRKIYVIGGWKGGKGISVVEEYDPVTNTWTRKANMPTPRSGFGISAVVDGKIYAIGGRTGVWPNPIPVSTVEEYDPDTDTWTKKADMSPPRADCGISVVDGKIYAIGGRTATWPETIHISTVEEYDPGTDTWKKKADMPTARWGLATGVVNNRIYAIGGGGIQETEVFSTVEEYTSEEQQLKTPVSPQGKLPTKWGEKKLYRPKYPNDEQLPS